MSELTHYDYEAASCRSEAAQLLQETTLVSQLKPIFSKDGNQWCFLYGENIQEGISGFGDTPWLAMMDFNMNFHNEKINQITAVTVGG